MEHITMKVPSSTARRWRIASDRIKEEAAKRVEQFFAEHQLDEDSLDEDDNSATEYSNTMNEPSAVYKTGKKKISRNTLFERKPSAEEIRSFYTSFQVDMSNYTFNRDEANER